MSDGIGLVLNSWLSNLYRPARGRKRLSSLPIATSSVVAAEQEITGMKVTEVRTARSCASWLSHDRSRAKPGPILSSSSFFSFQWRVAAKFPHPATDPAQQESWPCTISPAPRYSATVHSPSPCTRGGSSLMPSSHTDPEICARHNLGSSRPARRLPQCTLRRNLRSTAQPQKTKTLRASKALGLRL